MQKLKQFLDHVATHPYAIITYHASDMSLADHSDASHLYETKTRSRVDAHLFMFNNTEFPPNNEAVLTTSKTIKFVMSSAADAELGSLFINSKE